MSSARELLMSTGLKGRDAVALGPHLIAHLDRQLASAQRLQETVDAQCAAVRARDVESVFACLATLQGEMATRGRLEDERYSLLCAAGAALGVRADSVTLAGVCAVLPPAEAEALTQRSSALTDILVAVERDLARNRALIRQELAFVDHLIRQLDADPHGGYDATGAEPPAPAADTRPSASRLLDLQA